VFPLFLQVVLRPSGVLNYCVVDEGDSVLIDEARVPLIISGKTDAPVDKFSQASKVRNSHSSTPGYPVHMTTTNNSCDSSNIQMEARVPLVIKKKSNAGKTDAPADKFSQASKV